MYNRLKQMDFLARKISDFYEICSKEEAGSEILGGMTMSSYFSNTKTVKLLIKKLWLDPRKNTTTGSVDQFCSKCYSERTRVFKLLPKRTIKT